VPSDRARGNRHKWKHRRFLLNTTKHYFTVMVAQHWHRLPREVWNLYPWRHSKAVWTTGSQVSRIAPEGQHKGTPASK